MVPRASERRRLIADVLAAQVHLVAAAILVMSLIPGCSANFDDDLANGQRFLDANLPIGTGLQDAVRILEAKEILDVRFTPAECDGFVFDPSLRCRGGSGVVATVAGNINPWNPFYSPSLRVFLAFDANETLRERLLYIEGGDR